MSSNKIHQFRMDNFSSFHTKIDDYLKIMPLSTIYILDFAKVKGKNNWLNQTIIFALSNGLNGFLTTNIKNLSHLQRPDKSNYSSYPSAHTSNAFVTAELLHQEFKDKSVWISIAGYTLASSVGALRILNNKHWFSDVLAGAGIGMFSVKLVYYVYPRIQKIICKKKNRLPLL